MKIAFLEKEIMSSIKELNALLKTPFVAIDAS